MQDIKSMEKHKEKILFNSIKNKNCCTCEDHHSTAVLSDWFNIMSKGGFQESTASYNTDISPYVNGKCSIGNHDLKLPSLSFNYDSCSLSAADAECCQTSLGISLLHLVDQ